MNDDEARALDRSLERSLGQILDRASVSSVFGTPTTQDGVTVIPVAEVWFGLGFGYGHAPAGPKDAEASAGESSESGAVEAPSGEASGGGGGGGGGRARAVGMVRITKKGVAYEPFVDPARLAIAGMALTAWVVFWTGMVVRSIARAIAQRGS